MMQLSLLEYYVAAQNSFYIRIPRTKLLRCQTCSENRFRLWVKSVRIAKTEN